MNNPSRVYTAIYAWAVLALALVAMGAMVLYDFVALDIAATAASGAALFVLSTAYIFHRLADELVNQLEEEQYRLGVVVNDASDGIVVVDADGFIVSVNPAAERLFGYRARELANAPVTSLAVARAQESPTDYLREIVEAAENDPGHRHETEGLRKNGGQFPIEISISESFDREDRPLYTLIIRDVTARRSAEDALAQRRAELEHHVRERTRELKAANDLLEDEIKRRNLAEADRQKLLAQLQDALKKIKTLTGFIPICASCKKVRDDSGFWNQIEAYIEKHSHAEFSHGVCPDCMQKLYPEFSDKAQAGSMPLD